MPQNHNPSAEGPESCPIRLPAWFWCFLLLLGSVFCLAVHQTAGTVPLPWVDEASYSDPALNFVDGKGWRSGAWDTQPISDFWACNSPLYAILSLPSLALFGTSVTVWRTTWAVISSLGLISLLWGCYRWRLLKTPWEGLLVALCLWASPVFAFTATGGRGMESACLLVSGLAVCLAASGRCRVSGWAVAGCGFLIPWVGFQLGPVAFAVVGSFLLVDWRKTLAALLRLALGSAAGLAALLLVLWPLGVAKVFLSKTIASGFTSVGSVAQLVLIDDDGARKHFKDGRYDFGEILGSMLKSDLTLKVVFLLCLVVVVAYLLKPRQAKASPAFWLGICGLLAVPLAMMLAGRFVSYYYVFAFLPLVFALGAGWTSPSALVRHASRAALVAACVCSLVLGFPAWWRKLMPANGNGPNRWTPS